MSPHTVSKTATEASAVTAIALAATLAIEGEPIAAAVTFFVGVALFLAYEVLQLKDIALDEDELKDIAQRIREGIEDSRERLD